MKNVPMAVATQPAAPPAGPARVLALLDRPVLVALVKLTLSHCACDIRATATAAESATLLTEWQPHLAILDMDLEGRQVMAHIGGPPLRTRPTVLRVPPPARLKHNVPAFSPGRGDLPPAPLGAPHL